MNILKKLKNKQAGKPYNGFSQLSKGYHQTYSFRSVDTTYGRSILVELQHEVVFLPSYFSENLSDSDVTELNLSLKNEPIYLFFGGQREKSK